ncbi:MULTISPECIES: methyltransferase domain-containing protein [unclassified Oceanobacter]|uniref:methyltransferase domain-containing protein n=1 Tax=unclassified Oceanobacter TaxID=2620260 RepID=UPI0026E49182|nr:MULTISPECIES: methyltransferase domain-containing protein [unclassified Oceanobacter]MDO6682914.1 methyltransferase domain-containing protein [Oceanobacter sp. 5_MG-2023]MDP2607426.1 methyltransferase domain-containing protein [Oceanobacter sp. 1_MG-2023]MDP2610694.1 methyltransferase domain-containing protein [Oceanobacter sp. 2_MG-2023]
MKPPLMRNKRQVSQQFSRAANSYDQAATVQQWAQQQLMHYLQQQQPEGLHGHWLDIGCGTGTAFEPLSTLGAEHITAIDMAAGMLTVARQRPLYPHAAATGELTSRTLLLADADQLPLPDGRYRNTAANASTDASQQPPCGAISSLMLQWSEHPQQTLTEWYRVLAPGATLAIATLLPGTHAEIAATWQHIDHFRHINHFTSDTELARALLQAGFIIQQQRQSCYQEHYPDTLSLLKALKAIGATNVNSDRRPGLGGRQLIRLFDQYYPKAANGQCPLSYQLGWILATKPDHG